MTKNFACCPVCTEDYDLEQRLPKSLHCRHALCQACLIRTDQPLECCPSCQGPINRLEDVASDLTMIAYLKRRKEKEREKEQASVKAELQSLISNAQLKQEQLQEILSQYKDCNPQKVKAYTKSFNAHARKLFQKSLDHCGTDAVSSQLVSIVRGELEVKLNDIERPIDGMNSLMSSSHIDINDIEAYRDQSQTLVSADDVMQSSVAGMWNAYIQLLTGHLTDIAKDLGDTCQNVKSRRKRTTYT